MEEKSMMENLIECTIILAIMGVFVWGLLWAAEREKELGIHGMSSERILVQDELKNK